MTVSTTNSRIAYTGDGSTTGFSVNFYFLENADLKVYLNGTLKTITTHYTVSGAGNPAGGTVTFLTAPAVDDSVVIFRDPAILQETDYPPNDPFPAESHEDALDRLTMISQRLSDRLDRSFVLPDSDISGADLTLPTPTARKGIRWNDDGTGLENTTEDIDDLATDAAASAAAAASSASAAAGSASSASSSASAASSSASSASTSATNASNSATAASNSATTATTQAGNAATSATNAANSATAASNSATTATTQAGNAANSATNAANSATAAAGSATSAANSATAAATSYDDFDDRYLGSKAANPTTDNDGNALLVGALYWNSVAGQMRVWDGAAWQAAYAPSAVVYGLFYKADPTTVAFTKTGAGTASIKAGTKVDVAGTVVTFVAATAITMPALTAGTDYAIWAKTDGTLEATSNHTSPPAANARKVGGFHYAPGGHSGSPGGGNTTPGIWDGSFWDLKFRPVCPDPRGMEYKFGSWMDMYLTNTDAITLGSSRYNVTIADGSSPPKVPTVFGGNGSTTYGSYTWFEAAELASSFGKRLPTQREFMAHAYGTTEASSIGTDQGSAIHNAANAAYMSAAGIFQATGVMWIWADDRAGPFAAASWNANTEGRGSEYNAPNAVLLGGTWDSTSNSGSRCSYWNYAASNSNNGVGSRFCCDHLQLD